MLMRTLQEKETWTISEILEEGGKSRSCNKCYHKSLVFELANKVIPSHSCHTSAPRSGKDWSTKATCLTSPSFRVGPCLNDSTLDPTNPLHSNIII